MNDFVVFAFLGRRVRMAVRLLCQCLYMASVLAVGDHGLFAKEPSSARSPAGAKRRVLENQDLRYALSVEDGHVAARQVENRRTGKTLTLPAEQFRLEFQDGTAMSSLDCKASLEGGANKAELLFTGQTGIEVRVGYALPPGKAYLRKQISVRRTGGPERRLLVADLENWKGVPAAWNSMHADRYPFGSHPIYCEDFWAGVEFVAAFNEYGPDGFVLRSRPGGSRLGPEWLDLHSTVIGVAERGQVRPAFLRYVDDIRLAPARMTCCYNSWWTLPKQFSEQDLLGLAAELKRRLFDPHGVFFDVVAIDAGWSAPQSIWEVNRQRLPEGFDPLRRIVESAAGRLGLWISPSAFYVLATDCDWAGRNGFTVVQQPYGRQTMTGLSLADPAYLSKTKLQLQRLVRENGFAHVKFDGLIPREEKPHHDLLPGDDSVEPLAAHALELLTAAKQANPELVTEPTFLNSWFTYISPWAIKYADNLFGNAGGDYPRAIGPAPDYRESCTNAREWYIFSSLDEVWLPQNALQYFDVIHCDAAHGLSNHLAMAVGRGRFFLPVYANPKFISDAEWKLFAGLLRWARANRELLRQTIVLPSRVERGEPYGYAHWQGRRGMLVVRNPSNESKVYKLHLRAAGAPAELTDAVCYTQYPYRKGITAGVDSAAQISIPLQPWELAFVAVTPRSELREPVALGARWYCDGQGKMQVCAAPGATAVKVLRPGGVEASHLISGPLAGAPAGRVLAKSVRPLPEAQRLQVQGKRVPSAAFDVECSVSLAPGSTRGKVLLLVHFPSRRHAPCKCSATVNGEPAPLEERSSAGQLGYAGGTHGFNPKSYWAGMIPYECEWTWQLCDVKPGESRVRFQGAAARPDVKLGLWLWSDRDCSAQQPLPMACTVPEMPQYEDLLERQGICLLAPEQPEKP